MIIIQANRAIDLHYGNIQLDCTIFIEGLLSNLIQNLLIICLYFNFYELQKLFKQFQL